jgi:hypothetical protein
MIPSDLLDGSVLLLSPEPQAHTRTLAELGIYLSASIRSDTRLGRLLTAFSGTSEALIVQSDAITISIPISEWAEINAAGAAPSKRLGATPAEPEQIQNPSETRISPQARVGHRADLILMLQQKTRARLTQKEQRDANRAGRTHEEKRQNQ